MKKLARGAQLESSRVGQSDSRALALNPAQLDLTLLVFQRGDLRLREVKSLEEREAWALKCHSRPPADILRLKS